MDFSIKNVSQLVGEIKHLLEANFTNVAVQGEISNLKCSTGHWYFTLSDKDSSLSAALFKLDALRNPHINKIKDGDKVIVSGDVNVYAKRGTFQIVVKKIVPVGVGDLKEQYEKLKKRLAADGLFDLQTKKPIPELPRRVAIITAPKSAALQDFLNIYKRRSLWMDVIVIPAIVQGEEAPKSIRAALHRAIKFSLEAPIEKKIDLIVLARGGGSLEDLWAFNDEGLAWDLHNCPIPTISAVGHEVDYSISDFVCDLRAETPSAAAEVITQKQTLIKDKLLLLSSRLKSLMSLKLSSIQNKVKHLEPHSVLSYILRQFNQIQKRLNRCDIQKRLNELTRIHEFYLALDESLMQMQNYLKDRMATLGFKLENYHGMLKVLNPQNVLERGFSYVETESQTVVASSKDFDRLEKDSILNLHFHDGTRSVKKN